MSEEKASLSAAVAVAKKRALDTFVSRIKFCVI